MKKFAMFVVAIFGATCVMAQSVIVVDSEKIFKSLADYNSALEQVELLSKSYQAQVDAKFDAVEQSFNNYVAMKNSHSTTQRAAVEASILEQEKAATEFQQTYFANDGVIMKKRLEMIAPIQERVFAVITAYAESKGADVVLDEASNPSILYTSKKVDHTQNIITLLK